MVTKLIMSDILFLRHLMVKLFIFLMTLCICYHLSGTEPGPNIIGCTKKLKSNAENTFRWTGAFKMILRKIGIFFKN